LNDLDTDDTLPPLEPARPAFSPVERCSHRASAPGIGANPDLVVWWSSICKRTIRRAHRGGIVVAWQPGLLRPGRPSRQAPRHARPARPKTPPKIDA